MIALVNNADWDTLIVAACGIVVVAVPGSLAAFMNARDRRRHRSF